MNDELQNKQADHRYNEDGQVKAKNLLNSAEDELEGIELNPTPYLKENFGFQFN